ncbi:MAG: GIY-YIG nuclease family protein, partial [Bhargavaea sp.]
MDRAREGEHVLYVLECADGTYYAGYTNNLERRVKAHN